jgi:Asp-tRNA(Asn)/Glu-tRNA(Gln) amidotransferase A subunit family amidase
VRGPASHGSLVGLRPTTPLVSRFGMMPASLIARTVKDAAFVLDAIAGYGPNDPVGGQLWPDSGFLYRIPAAERSTRHASRCHSSANGQGDRHQCRRKAPMSSIRLKYLT